MSVGSVRDRRMARDTLIVASVVLALLALLWSLWFTRTLLVWLFVAGYLAWSLDPMAAWVTRKTGNRHSFGITAAVGSIFLFVIAVAWIFVPPIVNGARNLLDALPEYIDRLKASDASKELGTGDALDTVQGSFEKIPDLLSRSGEAVSNIGGFLIGGAFAAFMILSLMIYFMIYGRSYMTGIQKSLSPESGQRFRRTALAVYQINQTYWFGKFIIAMIAGAVAYLVMIGLGIPHAAPVAFFVAITDLIPNIGATIGMIAVAFVAAFEGWPELVISMVALLAYQQIENVVITPKVFKKSLELNPMVSLAGVTAGGMLFGLVGVLIAIPLIASMEAIWKELRHPAPLTPAVADGPAPAVDDTPADTEPAAEDNKPSLLERLRKRL